MLSVFGGNRTRLRILIFSHGHLMSKYIDTYVGWNLI